MSNTFRALTTVGSKDNYTCEVQTLSDKDLDGGEVTISSEYSSLNYKDALAVTGKGRILRKFPCVPGIDVAGTVLKSADSRFREGQHVLVTGCNLGESHDGGYSQRVRVPADWVVEIPAGMTTKDAMIYGTAGFTAALCLHRFEQNGQTPAKGPILVTGASGGVGQFAISFLSRSGFEVHALSGKTELFDHLKKIGASQCFTPEELELGHRPLERARWGGAIDNVGGELLSRLVAHIDLWGNIACVGLAGGHQFNATVMPMILRGVSLLGISSNNTPMNIRKNLWARMARELKPKDLDSFVSKTLSLLEVPSAAENMLARKSSGRYLVALNP